MVNECLLLISIPLLLISRKLPLILIVIKSDQLSMTNLDVFFEQEFNIYLGQVNVSATLGDDQVLVFLSIPGLFNTEGGSIVSNIDDILLKGKFTDFSCNQYSFLPLSDELERELSGSSLNLFFN